MVAEAMVAEEVVAVADIEKWAVVVEDMAAERWAVVVEDTAVERWVVAVMVDKLNYTLTYYHLIDHPNLFLQIKFSFKKSNTFEQLI